MGIGRDSTENFPIVGSYQFKELKVYLHQVEGVHRSQDLEKPIRNDGDESQVNFTVEE